MSGRDVTVIGAGIVGVSCARWLQRDGHHVRVLDPQPPGHGCSWGNAGVFACDSVLPMATPGTLQALPRMLVAPASPLRLDWRAVPALAPWLLRFAAQARPARVRAATAALTSLHAAALSALDTLAADRPAGALIRPTGWATVFETKAGERAARASVAAQARQGVQAEWLDRAGLQARIGGLAQHVRAGVVFPEVRMCADPGGLVARLAADVEGDGGGIEAARVRALHARDGGVTVETDEGRLNSDHAVVAAGFESARLARTLGDALPLAAERGYHAMLASTAGAPSMPVMAGEHHFVTTPMDAGVRLAGTSELTRADRAPDWRRASRLPAQAQQLFPGLPTRPYEPWMGVRATTPDSLPLIGRSPHCPGVVYATGHQHLGLTLSAITGRLVAEIVGGREPAVDIHPLRPERFALRG
jgi:D-amino-acid dehydrogenase